MARPHLLVTNDDGIDSPFYASLVNILSNYAELTLVVPADEQSWKGKSMTRVGRIQAERSKVGDHEAWRVSGTPADCVNLAIHNLMPTPPDLVVAGINIGMNAGLSLVLASGTVGACLEGNIAGIPGIALSQQLSRELFMHWYHHRALPADELSRLHASASTAVDGVWRELVNLEGAAVTWNVNLPNELKSTDIERTYLGHSFYRQVFQGDLTEGFEHRLQPFTQDPDQRADINVLGSGRVSATLLDIRTFGAPLEPG